MNIGKARHPSNFFIEPRIVLHRAATQRKEAEVDAVILAAKAGIMAYRFGFGKTGQADIAVALKPTEP